MAMQWILTWARTAFISISRKNIPPPLEHAAFDSQNEAVNFAMSLDHPSTADGATSFAGRRYCRACSHRTNVRAISKEPIKAREAPRLRWMLQS